MAKANIKQQIANLKKLRQEQEGYEGALLNSSNLSKKEVKILEDKIAATQKLRNEQKGILDNDIQRLSVSKKLTKARLTASAAIKDILSTEQISTQVKALQNTTSESSKTIQEEILGSQADILKLQKESQIASYDHELTLSQIEQYEESIAALKESDASEDDVKNAQDALDITKELAKAKQTEQGAQEFANEGMDSMLGMVGSSKEGVMAMWVAMKGFGAAVMSSGIGALAVIAGLLATAIVAAFNAAGDLRDELGVSQVQAGKLMARLGPASLALKFMGEDATAIGGALLTSFGTLESVTGMALLQAGNMRREFGASEDSIAGLAKILHDQMGSTLSESLKMVKDFGDQFEEAGLAAGAAMDDLAANAEFLADYLDGSAQSMIDATIGARKLGLELGTVAKIADALLEFETSIASTMQASLLIGRQLNFDRARGLALEGKTNEAVQDIVSQLGGVAEFQALNVVQRRGLAEALGVGTDELAALVRGEPIELDQDSALVTSNKSLIEAINNNTRTQTGGEALINATKEKQNLKIRKETNDILYQSLIGINKGANASDKMVKMVN